MSEQRGEERIERALMLVLFLVMDAARRSCLFSERISGDVAMSHASQGAKHA
jgi:hypothetical protein